MYLANNDPDQNKSLIKEFYNVKFSMCDTIDFWISAKRESVVKMFKSVDAVVINDEEARLLTKEFQSKQVRKKKLWVGGQVMLLSKRVNMVRFCSLMMMFSLPLRFH